MHWDIPVAAYCAEMRGMLRKRERDDNLLASCVASATVFCILPGIKLWTVMASYVASSRKVACIAGKNPHVSWNWGS